MQVKNTHNISHGWLFKREIKRFTSNENIFFNLCLFGHSSELRQAVIQFVLMLLWLGVDVSEHIDVREVDPEPAEQRGHPETMKKQKKVCREGRAGGLISRPGEPASSTIPDRPTHARRSWSMRLIFPPMKTRILQSPHLLLLVSRKGISRVRPVNKNTLY